jgi:hypothetical protein
MGRKKQNQTQDETLSEPTGDPPEPGQGDIDPADNGAEAESTSGEQLDLINVSPENMEKILPIAKAFRKVVKDRVRLTNKEIELRNELEQAVDEAKLQPLPDGKIKFKIDGLIITIEPTGRKVSVKEAKAKKDDSVSGEE